MISQYTSTYRHIHTLYCVHIFAQFQKLRSVYGDSTVSQRHLDAVRRYGSDMRFTRDAHRYIMSLYYTDIYSLYINSLFPPTEYVQVTLKRGLT